MAFYEVENKIYFFSLNLQCLEYVIYVNKSILKIFRIHIPRLTYRSKIFRNQNLHININLKHVETDFYRFTINLKHVEIKIYTLL